MMLFKKNIKENAKAADNEDVINEVSASSLEEVQLGETTSSHQEKTSLIAKREIRIDVILKIVLSKWKNYIIPCVATVLLSALYIFQVPHYYKASVMLAPESSTSGSMGGLSGLAAMAGVNINTNSSQDAIIPTFYPDLMKSTDFIVPLLNVKVETIKGDFKGSVGKYLTTQIKPSAIDALEGKMSEVFSTPIRLIRLK